MAYTRVWPEGWKDNEEGGTYINAAGLNKMEQGIVDAHEFMARKDNPHGVTKAQVGLGNVPNVTTNDQTPTYTAASTLTALTSGEKLSVAFGKLAKAVSDTISHIGNAVLHITAAERTAWNKKVDGVKGDTESSYRTGNVNITPANIGALPLSGGTLTGDLTLKSKNIKYQGTKSSYTMIGFIDNENDTYGNGMYIGGGGAVVVGGGESASTIASDASIIANGGSESLILANDGDIDFYSNVQNGVSNAKKMTLTNAGQLTLPSTPDGDMSAVTKRYVDGKVSKLESLIPYMEIYKTASGNPVVFTDGSAFPVRELSVTITPAQSGSGAPYPPGGGKNLCAGVARGVYCSFEDGVATATVTDTKPSLDLVGQTYVTTTKYLGALPKANISSDGNTHSLSFTKSADFSYVAFGHNGAAYDVKIICDVSRLENGTAYILSMRAVPTVQPFVFDQLMIRRASDADATFAPYSNIRPITGLSSVSVSGIGKNLFDPSGLTDGTNWSVDANGVYSGIASKLYDKYDGSKGGYPLRVAFREGVPYTLSFDFRAGPNERNLYGVVLGLKFTDGTTAWKVASPSQDFQSVILTTPPGKTLSLVYFSFSSSVMSYVRNIQLEEGSEATGYEPYRERSVAVPLADSDGDPLTVYGGTLDVTTGTLTVTHAKASASKQTILKSGSDTTGAIPFYKINNSNWPDYVYTNADTSRREELCNIAKIANPYNSAEAANYGDYLAIIMSADGSSTPKSPQMRVSKAVVDAMGNDTDTVEITYPLANPVTYQLTGQDLATLPGYNAVLTDADSVSVQYRADPTLAYEELESSLTNAILSLGANF